MDNRVKVVIGGAVVVLLLIVLAIFFFLSNVKKSTTDEQNTLNNLPTLNETVSPTPTSALAPVTSSGNTKNYTGVGFSLKYPNSWGLLTCTNSNNFEFDPASSTPTSIACDEAVKPITVLVANNLNCQGTAATLGDLTVIKSKTTTDTNYTTYRWCVPIGGGKALDITHRVDPNVSRATSSQDYSSQIEEMIKTVSTTPQGS
jgi:hypothetical protein